MERIIYMNTKQNYHKNSIFFSVFELLLYQNAWTDAKHALRRNKITIQKTIFSLFLRYVTRITPKCMQSSLCRETKTFRKTCIMRAFELFRYQTQRHLNSTLYGETKQHEWKYIFWVVFILLGTKAQKYMQRPLKDDTKRNYKKPIFWECFYVLGTKTIRGMKRALCWKGKRNNQQSDFSRVWKFLNL